MPVPERDLSETLDGLVTDLEDEFADLDPVEVEAIVHEEFDDLAARSKAPAFVGILAERSARERLDDIRVDEPPA